MANPSQCDTITKVCLGKKQARELALRILNACSECDKTEEVQHVQGTYSQTNFDGPWAIRFDIVSEDS